MADKDVTVRVKADIASFKSSMQDAGRAAQDAGKQIGKAGDSSGKAFDKAGTSASSAGDAMSAAGKASESVDGAAPTKAATGWDTLASKVDGSRKSMQTAGTAMTVLGGAVVGVGAAALNTGIQYNTLQQTTRAALTTITGSAEAANAQMDKLNDFASTSPFAKDVFIRAQQQLLAFGMEADKVLPTLDAIQNAVAATGGSSAQIGEISNVLAKVQSSGKITARTLEELGIRGIDAANIIGEQMGQTGDQIRSKITAGTLGADEALDALTQGMASKFDGAAAGVKNTFAGAMDSIKAAWRDLSADLAEPLVGMEGGGLAVAGLNMLADAMRQFQGLPDPFKNMVTSLAGLGGVATLAGGAFLLLAPRIVDTISASKELASSFPKTTSAMGKVGAVAGAAVVGLMALQVAGALTKSGLEELGNISEITAAALKAMTDVDAARTDLENLATAAGSGGAGIEGLGQAFKTLDVGGFLKALDFVGSGFGAFDTDAKLAQESISRLDESLTGLASSGSGEEAAAAFRIAVEAADEMGVSAESVAESMPGYIGALRDSATAAGETVTETELLDWALSGVAPAAVEAAGGLDASAAAAEEAAAAAQDSAEAQKEMQKGLEEIGVSAEGAITSMDKFISVLFGLSDGVLDVRAANRAVADGFRELDETIAKNGQSLDENTKKGSENQAALDGQIGALKAQSEAVASATDSNGQLTASQAEVRESLQGTYEGAVKAAEKFGYVGEKAEAMARDLLGIPKDVSIDTWIDDTAREGAQRLTGVLDQIPEFKELTVIADDNGTIMYTKAQMESITDRTVAVEASDEGTILQIQGGIDNIKGKTEYLLVTDDGTVQTVQTRINSVTGKKEFVRVSDDGTVTVVQGQINSVQDGSATVNVTDGGSISFIQTAINQIHGTDVAVNIRKKLYQTKFIDTIDLSKADGGKLPRNAAGSRLPTTGPGTDTVDGILGAKRDGTPVSWLDGGEWVVNTKSSDAYDNALRMINDDDPRVHNLKGLATGGRAGLGGLAKGGRAKTEAKAAAKEARKAAADRAKEARKLAAERRKEAAELRHRKYVDRRDYQKDARRGNIGGDMSTVDKLFDLGRNADYSKKARKSAGRMAGTMEKHILSLEKKSDALSTALETATKRRDELLSVKESVASGLRGEFSLSGMLDQKKQDLGANTSAWGIWQGANNRARKIEVFAGRLNRLRKMGYSEAIIQEVAGLGSDEGTQVAGILMNASKAEKGSLNKAYGRMDAASDKAGEYVTQSMYKGGLNAADGLVRGVEKKQAGVERAFYNLGKRAEGAFKRSLGIRSPSKVMEAAGINVGEGAELGVLSKVSDVQKAMGQLGAAPGMGSWGTPTVPPSREVAAYAAGAGIDYDRLASAVVSAAQSSPVMAEFKLDGHKFAKAVGSAQSSATRGNPKSPFLE